MFPNPLLRAALAAVAVFALAGSASAQPVPGGSKAFDIFKDVRDLMQRGKFDLAAEQLKAFNALPPSEADIFLIQSKYGNSVFLQLRNVLRWNDNEKAEKDARDTVEAILVKADAAAKSSGRDPIKIQDWIRKLAGSREDRLYAQMQLKSSGDAVTPVMVELLRSSNDPAQRSAILTQVPNLVPDAIPGFLAALEGLPNDVKAPLLEALAGRADVLALVMRVETDFTPYLWYYAALPTETPSTVRSTSWKLLNQLTAGKAEKMQPEAELTRLAQPFIRRTAEFRTKDTMTDTVKVYSWNPEAALIRVDKVPTGQAEEYYGLKYLRWAIERRSNYEPAQKSFLAFATERAVERAKFADISKTEPAVYQLLAAAPSRMLTELLQTALAEKRTALALGTLQAIGDRAQKELLGNTDKGRPSPAVQALTYPDPRVQFAAATALLRSPGAATHGQSARIVEILKRNLINDADGANTGKLGRAIIADPNAPRGEKLAATFRDAGFAAERFASGRQLMRRLGQASDYDFIIVDRHIVDPLLSDLLVQISADTNAARRPILLVASGDAVKPVPFEHLLLRLALLIAATENEDVKVPESYVKDPLRPLDDPEKLKQDTIERRDNKIDELAGYRSKRMQRLIAAADINTVVELSTRVDLRVPQLTYAVLLAEYKGSSTSTPRAYKTYLTTSAVVKNRKELDRAAEAVKDTDKLTTLMEQIETTMNESQKAKFESLREKVTPESLGLEFDSTRDLDLEEKLAKQFKTLAAVRVVPEPLSSSNLATELKINQGDPAAMPRDAAEKKATAKLAGEWLRKIALDEIPGYDIKPAEGELRKALADDDLAPDAAEALARIATADSQQALVNLALQANRPIPVRLKATDAAIRHVQSFGKLTAETLAGQAATLAESEPDAALKGKIGVLARLVAASPPDFGGLIQKFPVKAPMAKVVEAPKEPKN